MLDYGHQAYPSFLEATLAIALDNAHNAAVLRKPNIG